MADEPAIAPAGGPFRFVIESPMSQQAAAHRIEALRSRGLIRGFSPWIRTRLGGERYRVSADVGRNVWIHVEGTITPIPSGTMVTGELSRGLGWTVFAFGAAIVAVAGAVGLGLSVWNGLAEGVVASVAMLVGVPGVLAIAYVRIVRTQRFIMRKLTEAVEGTLYVAGETDRNSLPR